jgi:hydrogenase/urease accessory protein HupE
MKIARCIVALALLSTSTALAHPVAQGQLIMERQAQNLTVDVRVSDEQILVASPRISPQADRLEELWADHGRYLLERLQLHADAQRLAGTLASVQRSNGNFVEFRLRYTVPEQARELRVKQDLLNEIEYAPGNPWEATYLVSVRGNDDSDRPLLLRSRNQELLIPTAPASTFTLAWQFMQHGFEHILAGYDHLLFISALVLAVVSLRNLIMVVAAFTLAHSITLALSVLQLVRLPVSVVEPMIAGSIVAVALYNIFWPRSGSSWLRLATAFFFGLFHGLGFAGGFLDAARAMSGETIALAIASFSIGVECAHMLVVLPLFFILQRVHRGACTESVDGAPPLLTLRGGSALICVAGAFYLVSALQW